MKKTGRIPHKLSNGRVHCAESEGGIGLPNFLEEDFLEALAVHRYLLRKEFMEERLLEARTSLGSLVNFYTEVGIKRTKRTPDDSVVVNQVNAQRILGIELQKEGKTEKSFLQVFENRIRRTRFSGKEDTSSLSHKEEKSAVKSTFRENHKKVWDSAKMWSGYNNTRKDPDTIIEFSSLFLKLPDLNRNDIKKGYPIIGWPMRFQKLLESY